MKLVLLLLSVPWSFALSKQWIDPHDMNINFKQKLKHDVVVEIKDDKLECDCSNTEENYSFTYLKRLASLFINAARIDETDSLTHHGKLIFNLEKEQIQFLREFAGSQDADLNKLRKLDSIFSDMLHPSFLDEISDGLFYSQEKLLNVLLSKNVLPLIGLCLSLYISYNLFKSNFSPWYIFRYLIFIIVVIDFMQRYQNMSEEAEQHNVHLEYSSSCDTAKMGWFEYFKFLTEHQDCEKKMVSLLEVFLQQVKSVIIIPLSSLGTGMGEFGFGLWSKLPYPWNIIIFPIMLIFSLIAAILILVIVNNTPIKINIFHLIILDFGVPNNHNHVARGAQLNILY